MTTMVERVARELYEEDDPWHKAWPWPDLNPEAQGGAATADVYRRLARAAIAAMQEPTEFMANRGASSPLNMDSDVGCCAACRVWEDMIDAALNEEPEA